MTVQEWVDAYGDAWRDRDPDGAAALFADGCSYRAHPTAEAYLGPDGVRAYWADVTSTQESVLVRMGEPIASADRRRAAVEFWVRMLSNGQEMTVIGILFVRFADDGRCEALRETWHLETGDHAAPDDWGH